MKSDTEVTSPSTRWISSPGVCRRWKPWLRPSTCRASRSRMPFVVCHAVTVATQATAMLISCVAMATTKNEHGQPVSSLVVVPAVARFDDHPDDQRPRQDQARPGGHERAEAGPTPGVGPEQRGEGAPTSG